MNAETGRWRDERGEVASWLILAAGLALAAALASSSMQRVIGELVGAVGNFDSEQVTPGASPEGESPGDGDEGVTDSEGNTIYPDGTVELANGTIVKPDGTVILPNGNTVLPDGTLIYPDGTTVYPDGTTLLPTGVTVYPDGTTVLADGTTVHPDGTTVFPDGTTVKPNGTVILPDGTYVVPQQDIPPELQDVFDSLTGIIDAGDDLALTALELEVVTTILASLEPEDRAAVIAALNDEQLERLFHNVDSSGLLSDDLSDKERAAFYTLLRDLPFDQQQRLKPFTDYFETYDSTLNPLETVVPEADFVLNYEALIDLPIEDFLALRAHLWDNPELIADSPFDWYADGCSIPGGQYPGYLNGPCLRHDFAYRNARVATTQYGGDYGDVDAGGIAQEWKEAADDQLRRDIAEIEGGATGLSGPVFVGVAVDFPVVDNGKDAFELDYGSFYGPGYDPDLGQWPDDPYGQLPDLVDIASGHAS